MSRTKQRARKHGGKRKREEHESDAPPSKKQEYERPEQTTCDDAVSSMDPSLLADHFAKTLNKHLPVRLPIELIDRNMPARAFRDTTSFGEKHIAKNLPAFLEEFCGGEKEVKKGHTSSPHTLIITSSGIRAADLTRELRKFNTEEASVVKLFAKHIKMAESVALVEKTKINIGLGTPSRPSELIKTNVLKVAKLKRIVIDGSYADEKNNTIYDNADVFLTLEGLLNFEKIKSRLGSGEDGIELLVF